MSVTLADLRSRVRYYLDDLDGQTWSADELNGYINDAERWMWNTLSNADPSFGLREATATLVEGQNSYVYPSDILGRNVRALYVYAAGSGAWKKVEKCGLEELVSAGFDPAPYPEKYTCLDGYFQVAPTPDASGYTMRMYYHRRPTQMSQDSDNMDSDDCFADLIAVDAAIRALARTGGDASVLTARKAQLHEEAIRAATPEDIYQAKVVWKY